MNSIEKSFNFIISNLMFKIIIYSDILLNKFDLANMFQTKIPSIKLKIYILIQI